MTYHGCGDTGTTQGYLPLVVLREVFYVEFESVYEYDEYEHIEWQYNRDLQCRFLSFGAFLWQNKASGWVFQWSQEFGK